MASTNAGVVPSRPARPPVSATCAFTPTPTSSVPLFVEQGGSVVFEAEHYRTTYNGAGAAADSYWQLNTAIGGYVGPGVMQSLPNLGVNTGLGTNGPVLNYTIQFTTPGSYYVYVRGHGPTASDNSMHIGLNGNPVTTGCCYGLNFYGAGILEWRSAYEGNRVVVSIPAAGIYTLNLWMREDGVIVDRLWLSTSSTAVNEGSTIPGPAESGRAAPTPGPTATITPTPTATSPFTPTPTPPVALYVEQGGSVVFEGENYRTTYPGSGTASSSAWQFTTAIAGYVGAGSMQALPNSGVSVGLGINGPVLNPKVASGLLADTIQFTTTGSYYVYVRGKGPTGADNSIHVGLNGNPVTTGRRWRAVFPPCCYGLNFAAGGPMEWRSAYEGNRVVVTVASPGIHTLNIWMREDGVVVDRIWLSTSSSAIAEGSTFPPLGNAGSSTGPGRERESDAHTGAEPHGHTDAHDHRDADGHADHHPHAHGDPDPHADQHAGRAGNRYQYAFGHPASHPDVAGRHRILRVPR